MPRPMLFTSAEGEQVWIPGSGPKPFLGFAEWSRAKIAEYVAKVSDFGIKLGSDPVLQGIDPSELRVSATDGGAARRL